MVVVAAAASIGGRRAGAVTAIVAALSYNFLLTKPYLSLHVNDATDLTTVILLLVVGLVIGEFAQSRARRLGQLERSNSSTRRLEHIARLMVSDISEADLCEAVTSEIRSELDVAGATWRPTALSGERPVMSETGWVGGGSVLRHHEGGFELPADGVELPVAYAGAHLGTIDLTPRADTGVSAEQRRVAVALADLLASGVRHTATSPRSTGSERGRTGRGIHAQAVLIGRPLATDQADHQRISKTIGLAVFSSDAISSTAYATGEILLVLVGVGGMAGRHHTCPADRDPRRDPAGAGRRTSYRETIHAYPDGGGAYVVAARTSARSRRSWPARRCSSTTC